MDEFQSSNPPTRSSRKPSISVLQTIPSFSIYNSREYEDEDENDPEEELGEKDGSLARSVTIGDNIIAIGSGEFSFEKFKSMGSILEEEINSGVEEEREPASPPLYLAGGIGIDGLGFGNDLDGSKAEEHYKRMVEENPCNLLFLRNYAQFLYQSKGDLRRAEEYYSRAILLDPGDGEILSRYAKLVWELYHDHERATSYFERAVQFAPEDSHVLAAYTSFLWTTEEEGEEDSQPLDLAGVPVNYSEAMASESA